MEPDLLPEEGPEGDLPVSPADSLFLSLCAAERPTDVAKAFEGVDPALRKEAWSRLPRVQQSALLLARAFSSFHGSAVIPHHYDDEPITIGWQPE